MTITLADFGPSDRLRVALNHGNRVLLDRDPQGKTIGITVDLAWMIAERLGTTPQFVEYERAGDVAAAATTDVWDMCFLAVDPLRAQTITFTKPYIRISGNYLARSGSGLRDAQDVIVSGAKVGAVTDSAYTLHLARQPGAENLIAFETLSNAVAAFDRGDIQALAGVREGMAEIAVQRPDATLLVPPFMEIHQAIGLPKRSEAVSAVLNGWLKEWAIAGDIGRILSRHGTDPACAMI